MSSQFWPLSESSLILALFQLDISVLDDIISSESSSIEMKKIARIAHAIYGLQESMLLLVADSSVTLAELQGQINAIDTHLADLNLGAAELVCVRELWRSQVDHASKARFSSRLESLQQEPEPNLSGFAWLWQWLCGLVTYIIGIFKGVDNLELNEGSNFVYP